MASIESIVRGEIHDFIHNPITVADGYEFNQYENIKKTHLYMNSKFYDTGNSQTDQPLVDGLEAPQDDRIFFNITTPRVTAVKRFFDVDVADIIIDEIDPQSELALQFLNKEMDRFAYKIDKETNQTLSADLNSFRDPLIEHGSLVIEVMKNSKPKLIPLQRYFVDPTVARSKDSRFNTIKYTMSPADMREKVAKDGWDADAVEAIIEKHSKKSNASNSYEDDGGVNKITSSAQIDVYKRYGWLPRWMIDDNYEEDTVEGEKEVYTITISGFGPNAIKKGNKDDEEVGCLYKAEWKTALPIIDHHLHKTHGRWQGIGIVELLYPIQQRMNEICNQKRISMEISMLHLFQTSDPTVLNNILTDLENGDIISTKRDSAIQPIATEERNLAASESEIVTYQTQGDKMVFANDLLSGGDVPSSTPATNAVIQNNNQVLVHLQDRENFTIFIADNYITKFVVPQLIKEMSDEHFLRIVSKSEDLLQIDDKIVDIQFWETVKDKALNKGTVVDILQGEDLRDELMKKLRSKGPNRYVKVLKDYYKDKIGDVFTIIGNEKKDLAKIANNNLSFFQMLQNPQMISDPVMRVFMTAHARDIGIDTAKLELAYAKQDAMPVQPQQQGGLPKPAPEEKEDPALASVL